MSEQFPIIVKEQIERMRADVRFATPELAQRQLATMLEIWTQSAQDVFGFDKANDADKMLFQIFSMRVAAVVLRLAEMSGDATQYRRGP